MDSVYEHLAARTKHQNGQEIVSSKSQRMRKCNIWARICLSETQNCLTVICKQITMRRDSRFTEGAFRKRQFADVTAFSLLFKYESVFG